MGGRPGEALLVGLGNRFWGSNAGGKIEEGVCVATNRLAEIALIWAECVRC